MTHEPNREQVKYISKADEEALQNWAYEKIERLPASYVSALDILGWKIVSQDEGVESKFPYNIDGISRPCPDWCEDMSSRRAENQQALVALPVTPSHK